MIRIMQVIDEAGTGGGQSHLALLAEGLPADRFEVHLLCGEEGPLTERLRRGGILVSVVSMGNRVSFRSLSSCREMIRHMKPMIVHTHGGTAGFAARAGSIGLSGVRRVHTYHGLHYLHDGRGLRSMVYRVVDRALLRVTDRIICVSESDRRLGERHRLLRASRTSVIRNGIDLSRFSVREKRMPALPVVGMIGRLHIQKGHRYFLEAAAIMRRQNRNVRFRIVGDGILKDELKGLANRLGVSEVTEFTGDRAEIAGELQQLDVLALPSLWEGLPLVLLEAMAAGVPVVATSVDGIPEAVRHGAEAVLVPPGDPTSLAEGIMRVLDDEEFARRIARSAREKVCREFSAEEMVRQTAVLYQSLVHA